MRRLFLLVCLCLWITTAQAQEVFGKSDVWFMLLNHVKLSDKIQLGNELHIRRDDGLKDQEQFLIRPYLDYTANKNVVLTVGYTYISTSPYGKYPFAIKKPESNFWEQITLKHEVGNFKLAHRYRMEHRFKGRIVPDNNGGSEINGTDFANRFRYRFTLKKDLTGKLFVHAFDEIWFNVSKDVKPESFDRNWFFAAMGWHAFEHGNIQLGYLKQWIRSNSNRFERHPTLQVVVQRDF